MLKQAVAVVLFLPALAFAECGFSNSGGEMTIVVSKRSNNKCFQSENFRESFRDSLASTVKSMNDRADATSRRTSVQRKLPPASALPVQQAELYYGQNPKR